MLQGHIHSRSLYWLIPVAFGLMMEIVFFVPFVSAEFLNHHRSLLILIVPFCLVAPLGGWWAVYQCIRHEDHPLRYIVIVVLVPLGFSWYYFERYRLRQVKRSWQTQGADEKSI